MLDADGRLQRRLGAQARVARERSGRGRESQQREDQRARREEADERRRGQRGRRGQREARRQAQQRVVDHGQRRRPFAQERQARVDHAGADVEREGEHGAGEADDDRRIGESAARRAVRAVPAEKVRERIEQRDAHERGQHDHFAREPRRAPLRCRAPRARGPAEVEERRDEPRRRERERQQRAVEVEPRADRRRDELEQARRSRPRTARRTGPGRRRSAW